MCWQNDLYGMVRINPGLIVDTGYNSDLARDQV
jgi:hypothetical protein